MQFKRAKICIFMQFRTKKHAFSCSIEKFLVPLQRNSEKNKPFYALF